MGLTVFKTKTSEAISSILAYMEDCGEDCGFTKKDVQKCEKILTDYLNALEKLPSPKDKDIMKQVKKTVLALNQLNEKTDYTMLETEEREMICEILQESAIACGLQNASDDITEEWRDF